MVGVSVIVVVAMCVLVAGVGSVVEAVVVGEVVGAHGKRGYLSPNEFERRAAKTARQAQSVAPGRNCTGLGPCQIGRPGIHNHPLAVPSTPVSERDLIPQAIAHLSAGGDSPQPSTKSG